ncbi:MAG: peptidylprolyl isomerase [Bdellovibrionales bacterium]
MKKLLILTLLMIVSAPSLAAPRAMPGVRSDIVAVVNDSIITTVDLEQRLRLVMFSSGMPDSVEARRHMLPQILRSLIDEQLQVQEAKRLDISVSKEEVDAVISRIASDNKIPGDLLKFLEARGISGQAMISQVNNGLLWQKLVQRELRPRVEIGEDEIDAVIDRIRGDAGKEEYLVSEILLTVDNPKDEDEVRQVADNIVKQIRGGGNFGAIARQFSQGAGASQGGDIGWIMQGQLSAELNRALAASSRGQVSDPIRTANGFHILGVRDKRTISLGDPSKASLSLAQAFRPYAGTDKDFVLQEAMQVRASVKSCTGIEDAVGAFAGWRVQRLGEMNLSKAPADIADKVRNVAVGSASEPLETDKGVVVLFVCSRNENASIDRDAIMRSIGTEKLELQARRLLRDLRRSAFLDIRLGKNP